jgi:NADH:ubiquinone oxidoreductase subunit 5 (subunit L)/multisubunit Na+/H+ antiporter MnhA subunit
LDWIVFGVTAVIAVGFLIWGFVSTDSLAGASSSALAWVMDNTGWLFVLTASGFVVFVLWLALGRYGNIPLGRDDEEPEFHGVSWVAMMFSAGMGIGLMFFGVAEPLSHFATPPPGTGPAGNAEAVQNAMATTRSTAPSCTESLNTATTSSSRWRRAPPPTDPGVAGQMRAGRITSPGACLCPRDPGHVAAAGR